MEVCRDCANPLDEFGFTNCGQNPKCFRDRVAFVEEVALLKDSMTLTMIDAISNNDMPACFQPTRAMTVALGSLLMEVLRQNEAMAERLKALRDNGAGVVH